MVRRGLLTIITKLHFYGHGLRSFQQLAKLSTPTSHLTPRALVALKAKFIELVPFYMGAPRGEVNPHFRMLLSRRKTLRMGTQPYLFGVYTVHAARALWLAVDVVYTAISQQKRVLFISDEDTEKQLELQSLNCMLYESNMHAVLDDLSRITFYYTSQGRTLLPLGQPADRYFDLVVICLKDYTRVNRTTFRPFARFTLGACAQNTRPDLFDYYVPAMGSYFASVQLLKDVAILGYLAR